jgi:hypothetical protein
MMNEPNAKTAWVDEKRLLRSRGTEIGVSVGNVGILQTNVIEPVVWPTLDSIYAVLESRRIWAILVEIFSGEIFRWYFRIERVKRFTVKNVFMTTFCPRIGRSLSDADCYKEQHRESQTKTSGCHYHWDLSLHCTVAGPANLTFRIPVFCSWTICPPD